MTDAAQQPGRTGRLVTPDGEVRLGLFREPVTHVNHADYDLRTPFGRPVRGLRRRLAYNRFAFLGALSEELVFGCAVADVGWAGTAFVTLTDPATGEQGGASLRAPFARGVHLDDAPESGAALARRGRRHIAMRAEAEPPRRHLRVSLPREGVAIDAVFREDAPPVTPLRICTRTGPSGWVFARKSAGFAVEGTVRWGGRTVDLADARARGHADWTAGFMRRHTFWNWGCLSGTTRDGRALGLNVSCGVNETSFTESCFWLDGALEKLGSVHFAYDRHDPMKPWRLASSDRRLALVFEPASRHAESVSAGVVASRFQQLLGRYTGELVTAAGERIPVDDLLGWAEVHYAKW